MTDNQFYDKFIHNEIEYKDSDFDRIMSIIQSKLEDMIALGHRDYLAMPIRKEIAGLKVEAKG